MPTLLLTEAKIYGNPDADSILIQDERIQAVGYREDLDKEADQILELDGAFIYPGLHDSHLHLHMTGQALSCADLNSCKSIEEIIDALKKQDSAVIHGMGWNQENLKEKRMPTAADLDRVCRDRPVIAERTCTHILSANSKAMELAGLSNDEGIFSEDDCLLFLQLLSEDDESLIETAVNHCLEKGLSCIQPADLKEHNYRKLLGVYKKMSEKIRIHHQINITDPAVMDDFLELSRKYETSTHTFGPFKGFADGALGGRTAYLKEDYADDPGNRGILTMSLQEMDDFVKECARRGRPAVFHAIGDGAIEAVLSCFEKYQDPKNSNRFGILHVQITDKEILEKMKKLNTIAYIQPVFWKADQNVVADRVGSQKAGTSYAFGTLAKTVLTPLGTDCPIEDCDPAQNIYYAINSQNPLTANEAIDGYTLCGAKTMGREHELGKIEPGYLADLSVFSQPVESSLSAQAVLVIVNGKIVFQKNHPIE